MSGETVITVIGNLTADPDIRAIPKTGDCVVNFTVASTPRVFDRNKNQWVDGKALFMRCTVFREPAENAADSLAKGTRVVVVGKLQQREYTDRDGNKRTIVELVADEVATSTKYAIAKPIKRRTSNSTRNGWNGNGRNTNDNGGAAADDPWNAAQPEDEEVAF
ncbi:single-stranded DNA-binding protein [Nocardia macrotermitis]|uniref:Single-stranded DNA-binding protein n=1 Tax=Nocardia macrotermitis TaxID=2585198 RepID=A0A7K0DAE2_9NOCA|nr:single-stranded DNA-binding protein [Nocardia macrotermitis]MQY22677.1 Single-stranded DNA-binding protein [Nocardia macrotermitis]